MILSELCCCCLLCMLWKGDRRCLVVLQAAGSRSTGVKGPRKSASPTTFAVMDIPNASTPTMRSTVVRIAFMVFMQTLGEHETVMDVVGGGS